MQGFLENRVSFILPAELNMYYCGKREKTLNHSYGPMVRDHFLIVFVIEGNAVLHFRDETRALSAGDMLTMFPNEKIYYKVNSGEEWTIKWIGVHGELVYKYLKCIGVTPDNPVFKTADITKIEEILDKIFELSSKNEISDKIYCISLAHRIFSILAKSVPQNSGYRDYIAEAKQFMQMHYEYDISVSDVAKKLNFERSYFSKKFKEETGISPGEWIIELRIKKAKRLLKTTDFSVKDIANSVGIGDSLYFSRLFRRKIGFSPTEYRRRKADK